MNPKEWLERAVGYRLDEPLRDWLALIQSDRMVWAVHYHFGFQDGKQHTFTETANAMGIDSEEYVQEGICTSLRVLRAEAYHRNRPLVLADVPADIPLNDTWRNFDYDPWEVYHPDRDVQRTYHWIDKILWWRGNSHGKSTAS